MTVFSLERQEFEFSKIARSIIVAIDQAYLYCSNPLFKCIHSCYLLQSRWDTTIDCQTWQQSVHSATTTGSAFDEWNTWITENTILKDCQYASPLCSLQPTGGLKIYSPACFTTASHRFTHVCVVAYQVFLPTESSIPSRQNQQPWTASITHTGPNACIWISPPICKTKQIR